jgi:hypothetical protein
MSIAVPRWTSGCCSYCQQPADSSEWHSSPHHWEVTVHWKLSADRAWCILENALVDLLGTVRPIYRTGTPLPSKHPIFMYFWTNTRTEFFKHAPHSPFLFPKCRLFHNVIFFGSCIFTFYIQGVLKFKCQILVSKG